jgi:hypothetical protein
MPLFVLTKYNKTSLEIKLACVRGAVVLVELLLTKKLFQFFKPLKTSGCVTQVTFLNMIHECSNINLSTSAYINHCTGKKLSLISLLIFKLAWLIKVAKKIQK